ncbi:MAG: VIT1/CCC1 transporter family protein [Myxococcota bacterium]
MPRTRKHAETHRTGAIGWLRASVLGANDGIVSTASLVMGVAASEAQPKAVLLTGVAGLVAGALSMAAGEYVSVSSQADTERAEIDREKQELASDVDAEHRELEQIYVKRGLTPELARQVSAQLMKHDALEAHLRDELGLTEEAAARPIQAALASAASFAVGAIIPLLVALIAPGQATLLAVGVASLAALATTGALSARAGGARVGVAVARVTFWGALAMGVTSGVGALFGVAAG